MAASHLEGFMSNHVILLVARVLLAAIFILAGAGKFGDIAGTAGYIASVGLPAPGALAWLSGAFEVLAGLAVLAGFRTKYAALALAAFCVFTAVFFHANFADQIQMIMFLKNLAIAGGLLALSVAGPGSWSLDARRN
jgi:putative oxidoreductase